MIITNINGKNRKSKGSGKSDNAPQQKQLVEPIITVENDDDNAERSYIANMSRPTSNCEDMGNESPEPKKQNKWKKLLIGISKTLVGMLIVIGTYAIIHYYNYYYNIGVCISVTPEENIEKLDSAKASTDKSQITLKPDSVLGVALNIYELQNVKAEMTLEEPDTADQNILMYTRTADYATMGHYIGSLVINGKELENSSARLGYCAVVDGNMVIGISRFDDVKDYAIDHKGSFFRQFILVSKGELPGQYYLHGKVERKALARTADDHICIVETAHRETLWDFADALREYGYVDAIYLTGGANSGFYRDVTGAGHLRTKVSRHTASIRPDQAPWLVLKKR